jgi:streptogramin lyase
MRTPMVFNTLVRFALLFVLGAPAAATHAQDSEQIRGEPDDAAAVREQIAKIEKRLPQIPDRAAALYLLAALKQHVGETREALQNLKDCLALKEGFDPSGSPSLGPLKGTKEFDDLVAAVHRDFPIVAHAKLAIASEEKDLIPEGLAYDSRQDLFFLSSMHRRKIVVIGVDGKAADFVPAGFAHILPVLGIRPDPNDGTVWASSWDENGDRSELLHFDNAGKLLGRYSLNDSGKHGFNDLVVAKDGDIFLTDSVSNQVYRFSPQSKLFAPLPLSRELSAPNGIAFAEDGHQLFIADDFGMVRFDTAAKSSSEVNPGPHNTLAGIDGLYYRKGTLIAVQNGIGQPRIVAFRLNRDNTSVTQTTVLENRTAFTRLPTTGALRDNDFYFITNSGVDNLDGTRILDVTRLEPTRIAVVHLP